MNFFEWLRYQLTVGRRDRVDGCLHHGGWWTLTDLWLATGLSPRTIRRRLARLNGNGRVTWRRDDDGNDQWKWKP